MFFGVCFFKTGLFMSQPWLSQNSLCRPGCPQIHRRSPSPQHPSPTPHLPPWLRGLKVCTITAQVVISSLLSEKGWARLCLQWGVLSSADALWFHFLYFTGSLCFSVYYRNVLSTASPAHSWCCTQVTPGQDDCFWDSGITLRKALDSKVEADQEEHALLLTPALPVKLHVVLRLEAHFLFKWVTAWSVAYIHSRMA